VHEGQISGKKIEPKRPLLDILAEASINPTTKLLQVLRSDVPQIDGQEILAEFPSETYLSWE